MAEPRHVIWDAVDGINVEFEVWIAPFPLVVQKAIYARIRRIQTAIDRNDLSAVYSANHAARVVGTDGRSLGFSEALVLNNRTPYRMFFGLDEGNPILIHLSLAKSRGERDSAVLMASNAWADYQKSKRSAPRPEPRPPFKLDPNDLAIEVFRGHGPGGQHRNTTNSAVRITHKPTGLQAMSQSQRSQRQNIDAALKILTARVQLELSRESAPPGRGRMTGMSALPVAATELIATRSKFFHHVDAVTEGEMLAWSDMRVALDYAMDHLMSWRRALRSELLAEAQTSGQADRISRIQAARNSDLHLHEDLFDDAEQVAHIDLLRAQEGLLAMQIGSAVSGAKAPPAIAEALGKAMQRSLLTPGAGVCRRLRTTALVSELPPRSITPRGRRAGRSTILHLASSPRVAVGAELFMTPGCLRFWIFSNEKLPT